MNCNKCNTDLGPKWSKYSSKMCGFCRSIYQRHRRLLPKDEVEEKVCKGQCKENKSSSEFSKNSSAKDGLMSECKECRSLTSLDKRLSRTYKLTLREFNEMAKSQNYRCWICQEERSLVVDHNHSNGKVRGLLCSQCNTFIGMAKENQQTLDRAALYLRTYK